MNFQVNVDVDNLGRSGDMAVHATLIGEVDPGEQPVYHTANGDGYPGYPPHVYFHRAVVERVYGSDDSEDILREDRPEWVGSLDSYVLQHVDGDEDMEEWVLDHLSDLDAEVCV